MPDITYDVGRASFVMKGAWNLATNYEKLDAVTYDGSLYIAKQDVPGGTSITNTTYWQLAAEKGDKGDTGGVDSVNGQQGDIWFPDSRQLISDGYTTDTDPFLTKGNDSDSDRFELAKKLGNTGGVNQLVPTNVVNFSGTGDGNWKVLPDSISAISGHTYLIFLTGSIPTGSLFRIRDTTQGWVSSQYGSSFIWTAPGNSTATTVLQHNIPTGLAYNINHTFHDLTLWFGSNDRIPSNLLSHPENWGRYYAGSLAYNAGTLESADGTVLRSIGRNVWDEQWENGAYNSSGGKATASTALRNVNHIRVIGGVVYSFTVPGGVGNIRTVWRDVNENFLLYTNASSTLRTAPSNAYYLDFAVMDYGSTYGDNITISLYYPGESGYDTYYPYSVLAEVDTGSEVLRSAGAVADEKTPDGTIMRRVGVVDLGTLTWEADDTNRFRVRIGSYGAQFLDGIPAYTPNFISSKYEATGLSNYNDFTDKTIFYSNNSDVNNILRVVDSAYSDVAAFKAAMSGVYLYYELATPTTEQGTAFEPLVATVKGGVLSWTNTKGIPVGQESHWFENLRKRVEDRLPDPPSADGTYRLTCTISGGVKTYSWEA